MANIIASIVSVFFICHLPFRVAGLWLSFADHGTIGDLGLERYLGIVYSTRILFYLNHALNPVVYSFVSTKFRNALSDLFLDTACSGVCKTLTSRKRKLSSNSATTRLTTRKATSLRCAPANPENNSPGFEQDLSDKAGKNFLDQEYKVKINIEEKRVAIKFNFNNHQTC